MNTNKEKYCSKCGVIKPLNEFYKNNKAKDGYFNHCRKCELERIRLARFTKDGLITGIYQTQKKSSVRRGHPKPNYTRQQLRDWAWGQSIFHRLYYEWKVADYDSGLKPSFDRLDDYKPYTLDNLQIVTWRDNEGKFKHDIKFGINNKQNKAVAQCLLSGEVIAKYYSLRSAERVTGIPHGDISNVCNGKTKTAYGYVWIFTKW